MFPPRLVPVQQETSAMQEVENGKIIAAIMAEVAKGNTAPFADAMADDFAWRIMAVGLWRKTYEGKDVVRTQLFAPLFAQFEGRYTSTPTGIFADGDHVIVETQGAVTTKRGMPYNNRYCLVIRMKDGKMREVREYMDTALAEAVLDPPAP
jgi:ketosteroid isomerase-like protein